LSDKVGSWIFSTSYDYILEIREKSGIDFSKTRYYNGIIKKCVFRDISPK